jgi:hypothetical protein
VWWCSCRLQARYFLVLKNNTRLALTLVAIQQINFTNYQFVPSPQEVAFPLFTTQPISFFLVEPLNERLARNLPLSASRKPSRSACIEHFGRRPPHLVDLYCDVLLTLMRTNLTTYLTMYRGYGIDVFGKGTCWHYRASPRTPDLPILKHNVFASDANSKDLAIAGVKHRIDMLLT